MTQYRQEPSNPAHHYVCGYNEEFAARARKNNAKRAKEQRKQERERRALAAEQERLHILKKQKQELETREAREAREAQEREKILALYREVELSVTEKLTVKEIISRVAEKHRVFPKEILGECRERRLVAARTEAIYQVKKTRPQMSSTAIGRHFNRDHSTVLHALRRAGWYEEHGNG